MQRIWSSDFFSSHKNKPDDIKHCSRRPNSHSQKINPQSTKAKLTEDILGSCGEDDDLCPGRCVAHLDTRVAVLSQLIGEESVQLGPEGTVLDELSKKTKI